MDISSMLEVQVNEVKEVDSKENVTPKELRPSTTNVSVPVSEEENAFYKLMFGNDISAVRFHRLHCTACDIHIGSAPADIDNMFEHPILRTLLCSRCKDFYGDGTFEQGDDATDMFCRWCANGGNLYCCSFCSNTFCSKCIRRNFDSALRKKIEADEKWKCFVCDPTDLYNARATCWALLQHVQTIHRFLQNNTNLTPEVIEEKMNADESNCCPRRKRRKRRNSDEEDITYFPKQVGYGVTKRGRKGRTRSRMSNGSSVSMTDSLFGSASDVHSIDQNEIFPSLLSCEQTMVECENATVSGDGRIITQNQITPVHYRVNPVSVQQPTMYTAPVINVVANANFMSTASSIVPLRHVPTTLNHSNQVNLYQAVHQTSTPMVAIPNQNVANLNRPRFIRPKLQVVQAAVNSCVIEIESDSEDVTVVRSSTTPCTSKKDGNGSKAVPVALVSSKDNYNIARMQEYQERRNSKTLSQRLLPHGKDVDRILLNLRKKFQSWFEISKREELKKFDLDDARSLIKQFHRDVHETVTQLACINDRIVREYNRWKRHRTKVSSNPPSNKNGVNEKTKLEDIPLDMICINESDAEADAAPEYNVINPSELIGSTSATDGIKLFKPKDTVDRAVGDDSALLVDKSVQIYDKELEDYNKNTRKSTSNVGNEQAGKENNSLKTSIEHSDKKLKSYEEHFIKFLQSQSIEVEDPEEESSKELPDPNETSLKDLIEANSPFVSEMLETMDKSATPSRSNAIISIRKESDLKSPAPQPVNSISCRKVQELMEVVSNVDDKPNKKTVSNESTNDKVLQKERIAKGHCPSSDKVSAANAVKDKERTPSRHNREKDSESSNEDDCTIIDN